MASLSIPMMGDKKYRNALSAMARDRGVSMAVLVRQALDEKYGAEMKRYLSFVASPADSKQQTVLDNHEIAHG